MTLMATMVCAGLFAQGSSTTGAGAVGATEKGAGAAALTAADPQHFIQEAARGSEMEIQMAKIAEQQAQNPKVKQLAQTIENDHQQSLKQLQPIAQAKGVSTQVSLTPHEQSMVNQMKAASGSQFDKDYVRHMLRDHAKDIQKFQHAAQSIQDKQVSTFAQNTIPTLRKHLQLTETAARELGMSQQEISSAIQTAPGGMGGTADGMQEQVGGSANP
jgi:putative membrane protein